MCRQTKMRKPILWRITLQKIHTGAGVDGDVIGTKPSPTGVRVDITHWRARRGVRGSEEEHLHASSASSRS